MKNFKLSFLAAALLIFASVSLTSCGDDESEDPKPVKTDLEKAQEAVSGSVWVLQNAKITTNSEVINYVGDCNFSQFGSNTALASMTTDFKYTFSADGKTLSYDEQCGSQTKTGISYTVTQSGSVFVITYKHGSQDVKFEIQNNVEDMKNSEITVKRTTPLIGGAIDVKLTFIRS